MAVNRINPFWGFLNNPYPRPNKNWLNNHIPGQEVKNQNNFKREDKQNFFPKEAKTSNHLLGITDFFKKATDELKKIFPENWANDLFGSKSEEKSKDYREALKRSGMNDEQVGSILGYAIQNIQRIQNWAHDNEKVGKVASRFMSFALLFGTLRNVISGWNFIPAIIQKLNSIAYAITYAMRGFYQYSKCVYNRPDDEAAMNRYQAAVYGNKIAGSLGTLACNMETKVNPFALLIAALFKDRKILDSVMALFMIPNLSYWRGRMPAHINQECLTDLLRLIVHKPLALLHIKSSKEAIEKIKQRGNLEPAYVAKRHYENIGLKDKKEQTRANFTKELIKQVKNSFSKDVDKQKESAKKAGETIAPLFGLTAFVSTIVGTPLKLLLKALGKQNRVTDLFTSFSLSFQQGIYFFKMFIPEIVGIKKIKARLADKSYIKSVNGHQLEELKLALSKKTKLAYLGLGTFLASIGNSVLKLFKSDSENLDKAKNTLETLAGDLVGKFFSERRHVIGFQFKAENPELYEEPEEEVGNQQIKVNDKTSNWIMRGRPKPADGINELEPTEEDKDE